jgi:hypothetical protein
MTIIPHNFNGKAIEQTSSETVLNGVTIPKGYVNLSQMCKAGGKRLVDYLTKDKKRLSYFHAVLRILEAGTYSPSGVIIITPDNHAGFNDCLGFGITSGLLIQTRDAIGGDAGVYGHPQIAISVASWISSEFEAWAGYTLLLVLSGEFKALTEEAKQAEKELQIRWKKIRSATIVTRRELTDSIKAWYDRPDTQTNLPLGKIIAQCTNQLYQAMWGVTAAQIRSHFNLTKDSQLTRDYLSERALDKLKLREDYVIEFIDFEGAIPHENAVQMANIVRCRVHFTD